MQNQATYYTNLSAKSYHTFGMAMPGRSFNSPDYRFGFNGKENDKEWGSTLVQDYGFRIYNPALGKFLSVDPLFKSYPWYTPYQFAGNIPIAAIDLDGLEEYLVIRFMDNSRLLGTLIIKLFDDQKINKESKAAVYTILDKDSYNAYIKDGKINTQLLAANYDYYKSSVLSQGKKNSGVWNNEGLAKDNAMVVNKGVDNWNKTFDKSLDISEQGRALFIPEITPQNVTFETDKSILTEDGKKELDKLYNKSILLPEASFEIIGHTDNIGNEEHNQKLSEARSLEAKNYLISKGVDKERLITSGKGSSEPIANNETEQGRQINRRIEVKTVID